MPCGRWMRWEYLVRSAWSCVYILNVARTENRLTEAWEGKNYSICSKTDRIHSNQNLPNVHVNLKQERPLEQRKTPPANKLT